MAHIKRISFNSVGQLEGCQCDRCGQYIKNIWTVEYQEGLTLHYGIDCFEKVKKSGLNDYGRKQMNKILKSIQIYTERLEKYTNGEMTAETDDGYKTSQQDKYSYWYGRPYEEYNAYMINEFFPYRLSREQDELKRFAKVNFDQ